jgi:predicted nucleotidyltransferase
MRDFINIVENTEEKEISVLHEILAELKNNPLSPHMKVFGSAAHKPLLKTPADVDVFIDAWSANLTELSSNDGYKEALQDLLRICKKYYPIFDPFILITRKVQHPDHRPTYYRSLWCRNEAGTGWVRATKNIKVIIEAGKKGTPLSELGLDLNERAPHSKKGEKFIRKHKKEFKERYGEKWEQVLYATAWKLFGEKERTDEEKENLTEEIVAYHGGAKGITSFYPWTHFGIA